MTYSTQMSQNSYPLAEYPVNLACLLPGSITLRVPILNEAIQITGTICDFAQQPLLIDTDETQTTTIQLENGTPIQVECYDTTCSGSRVTRRVFKAPVPYIKYVPEVEDDELPFWFAEGPDMEIADMDAFDEFTTTVGSYALRKCQQLHGLRVSNHSNNI